MRIKLPELEGKELFNYLVKNKKELIRKKKLMPIETDPMFSVSEFITPNLPPAVSVKANNKEEQIDTGVFTVEVVGNAAWWCDYGGDVLTDVAYDKSVQEQGILLPHIKNHNHSADAHVGDVLDVYTKKVSLKRLGLEMSGSTTALIWKTNIRKDYDEKIYTMYRNGKINQHSIALQYLSIGLCINDKEYLPEYELWEKYAKKVINQDVIEKRGYFWIVPEIKIFENSCVLFGMNQLTPTLSGEQKELEDVTEDEPNKTTPSQPAKVLISSFDFKSLIIN